MGFFRNRSTFVSLIILAVALALLAVAPLFLPRFFTYLLALVMLTGLLSLILNIPLVF